MSHFNFDFSDGLIRGTSAHASSPSKLWHGDFDFALLGTSWDKRCTAILKCESLKIKSCVIVKPFSLNSSNSLDSQHERVVQYCNSISELCNVIDSKPNQLIEIYERIRSLFWSSVSNVDRSISARVFIDVSTCPRYFTLGLLREAFRSGMVGEICLGYSEGKYPVAKPSYNDLEDISFSEGAFHSIPVAGYYGEFEPSKQKLYYVSLGFDGWKTLNLLIRKEPERVVAILASPGGADEYEQRALTANAALIERFRLTEDAILRATAGDAIEAWQALTEASLENFEEENVYYLCSGNKPHSIAFALRAISLESPTLLYNSPTIHLPMDIDFNGKFWIYTIRPTAGTVFG